MNLEFTTIQDSYKVIQEVIDLKSKTEYLSYFYGGEFEDLDRILKDFLEMDLNASLINTLKQVLKDTDYIKQVYNSIKHI
jgi:hypothetical protein